MAKTKTVSMFTTTKICVECRETIDIAATKCPYCHHVYSAADVSREYATQADGMKGLWKIGLGVVVLFVVAVWFVT